jgi:hypothetical protein
LNRFAYRAYYDYKALSQGNPMPPREKDKSEIAFALRRLPSEVSVLVSAETTAQEVPGVGFEHSVTFVLNTTKDEASADATLTQCLKSLHLLGGKLDPATLTCPKCAALQQATDREQAGKHLRVDETANYTSMKSMVNAGAPPLETVFKVYRCKDDACRTRWFRYANKADGQFVGWHLAPRDQP